MTPLPPPRDCWRRSWRLGLRALGGQVDIDGDGRLLLAIEAHAQPAVGVEHARRVRVAVEQPAASAGAPKDAKPLVLSMRLRPVHVSPPLAYG